MFTAQDTTLKGRKKVKVNSGENGNFKKNFT